MPAHPHRNVRFAILGLSVTALFVAYQMLVDLQSPRSPSPAVMLAFVVLCPASLLSVPFSNAEVGTNGFYYLWTFIALLNAALYAAVRAMIDRAMTAVRRKKSD